jgi:Fic-DOC domain mobile mystery protein B
MTDLFEDEPEGATPLEPEEMEGLKFDHITTRGQLNEVEQVNIQEGLAWLVKSRGKNVLDESFIKKLHIKLLGGVWTWAGTFRKTEKNIGIDPIHIPVELRNLLDDVKSWITYQTYSPLEIAARFHHRLVKIHLFPNGNGRHSRIIADFLLTKELGCDPVDWSGGYDLQADNERREEYIAALRAADRHDYGPLLEFVGLNATCTNP